MLTLGGERCTSWQTVTVYENSATGDSHNDNTPGTHCNPRPIHKTTIAATQLGYLYNVQENVGKSSQNLGVTFLDFGQKNVKT